MVNARDIKRVLEERPDLEPAIEAVLEPEEPWSFDDVDVDSGAFGEIVSRGIVEKSDDGYRVANRTATRNALRGEVEADTDTGEANISIPDFDNLELGLLAGALILVVSLRLLSYPRVFRGEHVVLSANDPYYYRYWIDLLLTNPEFSLSNLPGEVTNGEPFFLITLWFSAVIVGGTQKVAGHILAWYPVVSAVITALLVYGISVLVTDDRRISLAAVAMLAVLPGHAMRTSLGFADHHAFDYVWLTLTLLGIVVIVCEANNQRRGRFPVGAGVILISVGVAAQILAWEAGPLLIIPIGLFLATDTLLAVHRNQTPLRTGGPVLLGTGLGALLTWSIHATLGWHTTLVASAPALLTLGGIGVLALGELGRRYDMSAKALAVSEVFGFVVGALLLAFFRPEFWARLNSAVTGKLLERSEVAEVHSLFGESVGWLLLFGFLLFLGVPYMAWATREILKDIRWLSPVVYGWYFFGLSIIQVRFVGEFSPVMAIFAGLGFVHLAERVDIAARPAPFADSKPSQLRIPDTKELRALVLLFLLVTSLSILQVPVKTSQLTVPEEQYETTVWMAEYSAERNLTHPEDFVFSERSWNRLYNYFVNGRSRSYIYAEDHFGPFVSSPNPVKWYDRLKNNAGFIVTTPRVVTNESNIGTRLHRHNGSRVGSVSGLAHYRLQFVSSGGQFKVFRLVKGAVITGTAEPNATVEVQTRVEIGDSSFTYIRQTTANAEGNFAVRVAHPGTYTVQDGTVHVSDSDVKNGTSVSAGAV